MATPDNQPLIAIVGPTASGKTALAIKLAQKFNGEIICADSRTVYKGMDIGTAKPTAIDRRLIRHHLLDVIEPNEPFSVADFQRLAQTAIIDIRRRGKTPFLVGGSGLYVDSIIFNYKFGSPVEPELRARLEDMTISQLSEYCVNNNIKLPENTKNKRYLVRTIERGGIVLEGEGIIKNCLVVGIATDRDVLRRRIRQRAEQLFHSGMLEEAQRIGTQYGWSHESMTGNIYQLAAAIDKGIMSVQEAKEKFTVLDWRLAKRQLTWLRRNPFIQWGSTQEVGQMVEGYLK